MRFKVRCNSTVVTSQNGLVRCDLSIDHNEKEHIYDYGTGRYRWVDKK